MSSPLFLQTNIAVMWDFDTTLVPGYMQKPLFEHFKVDEKKFWQEVNSLPQFYRDHGAKRASKDTAYLHHILAYVRAGLFPGLTNKLLTELGAEIDFYSGLPDFFTIPSRPQPRLRGCERVEESADKWRVAARLRPLPRKSPAL